MSRVSINTGVLVLLLWLAGLGAAAQFAKFAVPFATVRAQYPDAGSEIGWLLTLISALGAVLGMTAGMFVGRIGLGKAVVVALILGGGISFVQTGLPNLSTMMISRVIEGISHLMIVVAAPTLIAQVASDRFQGLCMTLWSTFFGVSFALIIWGGLPLVATWGLDGLLIAHGTYMLAMAVALGIALTCMTNLQPLTVAPLSMISAVRLHIDAYRSATVVAPAIGWLFYTMTFVSLLAVLPDLLPATNRAAIVGAMPLVSIAVSLVVVSVMLAIYSAVTITVIGFGLSAAMVLMFFAGLPLPYICIGLFATLGLIQGASFAAVPDLNTTAETRALANGAMAQMGNLGNLLGTPVLLAVLAYAGHGAMLMAVAVLYVIGGAAHLILAHVRRQS